MEITFELYRVPTEEHEEVGTTTIYCSNSGLRCRLRLWNYFEDLVEGCLELSDLKYPVRANIYKLSGKVEGLLLEPKGEFPIAWLNAESGDNSRLQVVLSGFTRESNWV